MSAPALDTILEDFAFLDDWEDRYRYIIELGRGLDPLSEGERNADTRVEGCASQVWLVSETRDGDNPVVRLRGDSDAHIVRGLIAILLALYSNRPAGEIVETDAAAVFERLGLGQHLSPQRSNGFSAMVERIRRDARAALADRAMS